MDADILTKCIVLVILLVLSAYFSSAETALTTVNIHRIRTLAEEGNVRARRVLKMRSDPGKMLSAILIGNNVVNLSASSLTTTLAIELASSFGAGKNSSTIIGVATGVLTLLILVFGEITPKTVATVQNERLALFYSASILALTTILTPVIFLVNGFSTGLCRLIGVDMSAQQAMTEQEFRTIVNVSQEEGVLEEEEKDMINNVVDFGDSVAKDVMVPRINMVFAGTDMSLPELIDIFKETQYSRLPVYEDSKDKVIGILNLKDLFFYLRDHSDDPFELHRILREPFFTYEFQKTSVLMEEMRRQSISFAIVLDEYGATAGLVTLEDLIEEIVGDIRDEFDTEEPIVEIGENEYEIEGGTRLDDINDRLGTDIESDEYDSIGGHLIGLLGRLPREGDTVREGDYLYSIRKMEENRVGLIDLRIDRHGSGKDLSKQEKGGADA